jgi:hypothetical protein
MLLLSEYFRDSLVSQYLEYLTEAATQPSLWVTTVINLMPLSKRAQWRLQSRMTGHILVSLLRLGIQISPELLTFVMQLANL